MNAESAPPPGAYSDQDVSNAYIYLLGRLLVARQQQLDFDTQGFAWNELLHRWVGDVDWPNPNLDVAYSEAWVAIDEESPLLVTIPPIRDRYFVLQFLNGWGETVANLNARLFPHHPDGLFAICLEGSAPPLPPDAVRVDVPTKVMRVLARIELGADPEKAVAMQHAIRMRPAGRPELPDIPRTPMFPAGALPAIEAFESAELALAEPDLSPGAAPLQALVRAIAASIRNPDERARVDAVIRRKAWRDFMAAAPAIGRGDIRNGWARPSVCGTWGDDFLSRSVINYGGIWANVLEEVVYYRGALDASGARLDPSGAYTLTFPADALPARFAEDFWSVIAVDATLCKVLPNPLNRYLINNQSDLTYGADGSLTLYFAAEKPVGAPPGNWLPTAGGPWQLTFRFYGPTGGVADGSYFPPPLVRR